MAFEFVVPGTTKLDLGDGDWIEVKLDLTIGEIKALESSGLGSMARPSRPDEKVEIKMDWRTYSVSRCLAWILDWNAKDPQGRPVKFEREAIEQLSLEAFDRIETAITEHIKQRAEEKKTKTLATASAATSS